MSNIIKTKQSYDWHFVYDYLELLYHRCITNSDSIFEKKYSDLMNYVGCMFDLEDRGDIIDSYVVVEQQRYIPRQKPNSLDCEGKRKATITATQV